MEKKDVIIERAFILKPPYQLEEISKCFEKLNKLIRQKNNLSTDTEVLWIKSEGSKNRIGYKRNPESINKGLHYDVLLEHDITTNKAAFLLVIYDAILEWGLAEDVSVYGAPEEDRSAGFIFTLENREYHYIVYIEIAIKKAYIERFR
jgi:hypothetical protein